MKLLFNILIGVVVLLIIADAFIWLLATGSGHNLPDGTHKSFGYTLLTLIAVLILIILLKQKGLSL